MALKMKLGDFIAGRLADVGCFHVFGVPGDYSLNFMNCVVAHPQVSLINCLNELNVSYAAEAYARVNGFGAMTVVMGVGELCTLNGLGCANAEKIPMLLIVGVIPTCHVKNNVRARHMTDPFDQHRATKTTASCVEACVYVDSMDGVIDRIDELLVISLNKKRPVALHIPADLQVHPVWVPRGREHLRFSLGAPLRGLPLRPALDEDQIKEIEYMAGAAMDRVSAAKKGVIVVGNQVVCYNLQDLVRNFAEALGFSIMHVPRLTGVVPKDHPNFVATGPLDDRFDCVVQIGFDLCDMYAGITQNRIPDVQLSILCVKVGDCSVSSVFFPDVLASMYRQSKYISEAALDAPIASVTFEIKAPHAFTEEEMTRPITAKDLGLWAAENGRSDEVRLCCSGLTVWDMLGFPSRLARPEFIQEFYATIGWALPATMGAMFAYESLREKPVLSCWIGDGAFVMTAQELSSLHRYSTQLGFMVQIFLLDNKGYLIERVIHENIYNDLPDLNYCSLASFSRCHYARITTLKELEEATAQPQIGTTLMHIELGQFDCLDQHAAVAFGGKLCAQNKIPLNRPTLPGF